MAMFNFQLALFQTQPQGGAVSHDEFVRTVSMDTEPAGSTVKQQQQQQKNRLEQI